MAKETVIFRNGPLDNQTREIEPDKDYWNYIESKPDRIIIHHYRRVKKGELKPGELPLFELYGIEHINPATGERIDK